MNKTVEELMKPLVCPDCGGTGIVIDYVAACCRNPNEDGSCCNCPIAEPVQEQCARCETTGYLKQDYTTQTPNQMTQIRKFHDIDLHEKVGASPFPSGNATPGKSIYLDGMIYENVVDFNMIEPITEHTNYGAILYLKNFTSYSVFGDHNLTNYQEVVEGKDYVKQWQEKIGGHWQDITFEEYHNSYTYRSRRIIALPIQAERGGEKEWIWTDALVLEFAVRSHLPGREITIQEFKEMKQSKTP